MRILTLNETGLVAGGMRMGHSDGTGAPTAHLMIAPGEGGGDWGDDGGGYGEDLPSIDFTLDPIDFGGLDTTFTFNDDIGQVDAVVNVDDSYVQNPVMSPEVANAIGSLAQSACGAYAKRVGGQMACAGLGTAVGYFLTKWTSSRADGEEFLKGMEAGSKWGALP